MEYCRRYVVSGLVQGVGFRYHSQSQARGLALSGWVRNLPDGKVELMACGGLDQLDRFYAWLLHGPPSARVDDVEFEDIDRDDTQIGFSIR